LITFTDQPDWVDGLASLQKDGRVRQVTLTKINGKPAAEADEAERLRAAGFVDTYKGLRLRS
jgi:hypothetical protein